ncbi:23S rRNA (guanosine(2251)-2'-O)-methyltransferase RlmB [Desulfobacca acetoxidans]|uniref:RNA methyltransferase, TrmH family, group 3 n=1 Tax=Desulfobacca acetoxidans (strain ATCC 700848 / DSM 11109 / ASRB2) TaxID=880072 RepID=F2NIH0_DESAR|nr:23S rRNA (guanosine(2251)-2'-O)-methyltransferase RlmB [Desulfobacca acetoxidans]AEB10372.1 RNA methyltransferase, TrmH family, group 3 [Desulfobacca acetoxidans DSM 11109]
MQSLDSGKLIYGVHPVLEALRREGNAVEEVIVVKGRRAPWFEEVKALAQKYGVRFRLADQTWIKRLVGPVNHQGVIARTHGYRYMAEPEMLQRLQQADRNALLVVADCIQDPMNLGNLLRTAYAVGAQGVLIPKDRAVGVTSVVIKAAAGAMVHLPVCRVTNLTTAITHFKEIGLWVIGAEATASQTLYGVDLTGPLALVIGGEGQGLRPRVKQACDLLVAIPMAGEQVGSLNAATAGAVMMYEIYRQRAAAQLRRK